MKFKKKKYRESIKPKLYDGLHPGGLNEENSVCFPNCVISLKKKKLQNNSFLIQCFTSQNPIPIKVYVTFLIM